jgi:uncharacterized repeat protein (TIGR03803 family)
MKLAPALAIATILLLPARIAAQAQFETIFKFSGSPDSSGPQGLAAGPHGMLYGMTVDGGSAGYGTVFQLTPPSSSGGQWTKSTLYEFTGAIGSGGNPVSAPVLGKDGSIYGATATVSTIFQLQPPAAPGGAWVETALYPPSEAYPAAEFNHGLIAGPNGEIYAAGSAGGYYSCGGVVGLTPPSVTGKWSVSFEYDFPGGSSGCEPAGITLSADGVVYGVTTYGGTSNQGIVFALSPSPVPYQYIETVLYNFTGGTDGGLPSQPPTLASVQTAGAAFAIYGTTASGGLQNLGGVFELVPDYYTGTWTEYFPFSFSAGKIPSSALLESNGDFYGATATGPVYADAGGSTFQLYPYDQILHETVLHSFEGPAGPSGNLIMSKNGVLYGSTVSGPGPAGFGTVYRLKP